MDIFSGVDRTGDDHPKVSGVIDGEPVTIAFDNTPALHGGQAGWYLYPDGGGLSPSAVHAAAINRRDVRLIEDIYILDSESDSENRDLYSEVYEETIEI